MKDRVNVIPINRMRKVVAEDLTSHGTAGRGHAIAWGFTQVDHTGGYKSFEKVIDSLHVEGSPTTGISYAKEIISLGGCVPNEVICYKDGGVKMYWGFATRESSQVSILADISVNSCGRCFWNLEDAEELGDGLEWEEVVGCSIWAAIVGLNAVFPVRLSV